MAPSEPESKCADELISVVRGAEVPRSVRIWNAPAGLCPTSAGARHRRSRSVRTRGYPLMSDASDREAIAQVARVKEESTAWLLSLPGVNLVAIGGKETDGRPTGELAVQVYVDAKLPLSEIPPEQRIPEEIDGVKTDVYVGGDMVPLVADGALLPEDVNFDESRNRPVIGGSLISMPGSNEVGTLGCFVSDPADINIAYGLTCGHVIFSTDISPPTSGFTKVGQPSAGRFEWLLRGHHREVRGRARAQAGPRRSPDRALARHEVSSAKSPTSASSPASTTSTLAEAQTQSFPVRKRGGRTRLTGGVVIGLQATGPDVENLLVIRPNANPAATSGSVVFFAAEGDSGSALVDDTAVGSCQVTGIVRSRDKTNAERVAEGKPPRDLTPDGVELVPAYAMPVTKALKRLKDIENIHDGDLHGVRARPGAHGARRQHRRRTGRGRPADHRGARRPRRVHR